MRLWALLVPQLWHKAHKELFHLLSWKMKEGSWSLCVTSRTCWTVLIQALPPNLVIKSLLTLVVENTFSEMRSGATDIPLRLEFDYRFSRAIKERLKKQCFIPFVYFTAPKSYYPQVFTTTHYKDLPKLCPPKAHKLSEKQVSEMRTGEQCMVRVPPRKQCETWKLRTI